VRWGRRIFLAAVALVVLAVLSMVGLYFYQRHRGERALQAAMAEADRDDPGWRLEDIEAQRSKVPPGDNAAIPLLKAAESIPDAWAIDVPPAIESLPPTTALDAGETEQLRKILKKYEGVVPITHQALARKQGWIAIQWTPDYISTALPALQRLGNLGGYLRAHADWCSKEGDFDNAWLSGLAILAIARAVGEQPGAISQIVRLNLRLQAIASLERTLALVPKSLPAKLLEEAQRQLADEAAKPATMPLLRGERAGLHLLLTNLEAGVVDRELEESVLREDYSSDLSYALLTGNSYKHDHAWLLDFFNKAVAIARLPPSEQLSRFQQLEDTLRKGPALAKMLMPALVNLVERDLTTRARLDCATAAIAVERFRLARGSWPNSLEEVVAAKLLDRVPVDVFDGKPLRYRKTANGVVVYSVGPDGTYKGDALDILQDVELIAQRYEFRLWNPEYRGKGPRPRPAEEDHPKDDRE
jgi:hypothetical protein